MSDVEKNPINFMKLRKAATALSVALVVISFVLLGVRGLNFGQDFTGGTSIEVEYAHAPELESVRAALRAAGYDEFVVQNFGADTTVLVRLQEAEDADLAERMVQILRADGSELQLVSSEFVGSQVGDELKESGGIAILLALVMILIYVGMRFQFKFGVAAVLPLAHDVIIVLGFFALFQWTFDLTVLAAVLAVIGYSLNDTIVVADRIRENFRKIRDSDPVSIINESIYQTLNRTINTSVSTLLVLISLYLFGGDAVKNFSIAMSLGVIIGTYSTIYVAASILIALKVDREDLMVPVKEGAGGEDESGEEQPPEWLNRM